MTDQGTAPALTIEQEAAALTERNNAIGAWLSSASAAKAAVTLENDNRAKVTAICFPTPKKGTQRFPLANGFALKLVFGWNYTLGNKDLLSSEGIKVPIRDQVQRLQDAIEKLGPEAELLAARLIKWSPELVVSEYELLDGDNPVQQQIRNMIDAMLTVTPKAPQLTFEEPKT